MEEKLLQGRRALKFGYIQCTLRGCPLFWKFQKHSRVRYSQLENNVSLDTGNQTRIFGCMESALYY